MLSDRYNERMAPRRTVRDPLGGELRDRRQQLGLSVRALAHRAGISPAYVSAIETGHNPSTGRPPVPSAAILSRIADALALDVQRLIRAASAPAEAAEALPEHVLLYSFDEQPAALLPLIDELFGSAVDHWLYIADPRGEPPGPTPRATICRWNLGEYPYATPHLDPADIVKALESQVQALATTHAGRRVGIAITDCSAVMRYVQNADAEVGLESTWHDHVDRIWVTHLGARAAIDVCAYRHDDIEALGLTIDQLGTALDLITNHDRVVVVSADRNVATGASAIRRLLQPACPPGTSARSWASLTDAAAGTLATAHACDRQ